MATGTSSDPLHNPAPAPRGAKDTAEAKLNEQKDSAASDLGNFAQALRRAAGETGAERQPGVGRVAQLAADSLERLSGTLRNKDLNGLVREVESFARHQPVAFFGAAVATGFLAIRFVKSSSRTPTSGADRSSSDMPTRV
jgi:hypothetical protein